MNKRQEYLLTILLEESYISIIDLANKLECSERTIKNNCKDINEWLASFSNMEIKRDSNKGIKLVGDEKDKFIINQKLRKEVKRGNSDIHRYIEILSILLLESNKKIVLNDICNKLYMNKNIIREELNKLSCRLSEYGISISAKNNLGITLQGSEKNIRIMFVDFLFEYIDTYRLSIEEINKFHQVDIIVLKNIMNYIEENLHIRFTDISFKQLTLFLLVSVVRIRTGNLIIEEEDMKEEKLNNLMDNIEKELKTTLAINLNKTERFFISSLILSMNKQLNNKTNHAKLYYDKELPSYTKNIINIVSGESGINFNDDVLLYEQLLAHLNATFEQIKNNVFSKNPLLDDIKSKYCFLFTVISNALRNENIQDSFTEDEVGYLTLHFQVSLERKTKKVEEIKRAIIVCPLSFGVSTLLKVKIEKAFSNIHIVETIREKDLKMNKLKKNVDFIITFRENDCTEVPIFVTSPLFNKDDEEKLKEFINKVEKRKSSYSIINRLMISENLITEVDSDDIYKVIEQMANVLVDKHYVEKEYVESIIEREKTYTTNIGNGLLLPHGDIKYVKQSILSFTRLVNPIEIRNGQFISIIIMLTHKNDDRKEFHDLFKEVSALTEDKDTLEKIATCDIKEIKEILI